MTTYHAPPRLCDICGLHPAEYGAHYPDGFGQAGVPATLWYCRGCAPSELKAKTAEALEDPDRH